MRIAQHQEAVGADREPPLAESSSNSRIGEIGRATGIDNDEIIPRSVTLGNGDVVHVGFDCATVRREFSPDHRPRSQALNRSKRSGANRQSLLPKTVRVLAVKQLTRRACTRDEVCYRIQG